MLIDTGFPGFDGRDAERIILAAKDAGIERLDYVLITHYHRDHVGGVVQLAQRIPIGQYLDHGANVEDSATAREGFAAYSKLWAGSNHRTLRPGNHISIGAVQLEVLASAGNVIGPTGPGKLASNPLCASESTPPEDPTENAQSVGILLTFAKFHFLDLGDLTKEKELALVCPHNPIPAVDLFLSSHHGLDVSNSRALVHAVHPTVAIMNNGPHKGGKPAAWEVIHDSPGLQDLWQLHYALDADKAHNTDEQKIANLNEGCKGNYLKASVEADGAFSVLNSRNHFSRTYKTNAGR